MEKITIPVKKIYARTNIIYKHIEMLVRTAIIFDDKNIDFREVFNLALYHCLIADISLKPHVAIHILKTLIYEFGTVFDVAYTKDKHEKFNRIGRGPYLIYEGGKNQNIEVVLAYELLCSTVVVDIGHIAMEVVDIFDIDKITLEKIGYPNHIGDVFNNRRFTFSGIKRYLECSTLRID